MRNGRECTRFIQPEIEVLDLVVAAQECAVVDGDILHERITVLVGRHGDAQPEIGSRLASGSMAGAQCDGLNCAERAVIERPDQEFMGADAGAGWV